MADPDPNSEVAHDLSSSVPQQHDMDPIQVWKHWFSILPPEITSSVAGTLGSSGGFAQGFSKGRQ